MSGPLSNVAKADGRFDLATTPCSLPQGSSGWLASPRLRGPSRRVVRARHFERVRPSRARAHRPRRRPWDRRSWPRTGSSGAHCALPARRAGMSPTSATARLQVCATTLRHGSGSWVEARRRRGHAGEFLAAGEHDGAPLRGGRAKVGAISFTPCAGPRDAVCWSGGFCDGWR